MEPDSIMNVRFEGDEIDDETTGDEDAQTRGAGGTGAAAATSFVSDLEANKVAEVVEGRQIIAGTVEKLIEKLCSHLNYGE